MFPLMRCWSVAFLLRAEDSSPNRLVTHTSPAQDTIMQQSEMGSLMTSQAAKQEKCYDPGDKTLKFVDGEDVLDFPRAQMSCGHAVTLTSLTNYLRQLDQETRMQQSEMGFEMTTPAAKQETFYHPGDKMLQFVDGKDILDFLYQDFESLRAQMSCGHAVTPTSLTNYLRQLDQDTIMQQSAMGSLMATQAAQQEKCYDPGDKTLKFVDGEDILDFLCEDFKSPRAQMSCGHAVTPTSLTNWCLRQLDQGDSRFVCGQFGCGAEWSYVEVCKMALLTPEEKKYFEKTLAFNAARQNFLIKACPGCKSPVMRTDESTLNVCCKLCTANNGQTFEFCWQCLRKWKGRKPRSDRCGNNGCCNQPLKTLQTCPDVVFESMPGITGCPSIRACPTCGSLLEHSTKYCKSMVCPRCKVKFCFVCLKLFSRCLKSSQPYTMCSRGVAPRQTSIPVWNHMNHTRPSSLQ